MAIPTTRDEFKSFCLRTLGAPVLQINVDDDQADDRIDQAIYKYQQFHMDAVVKTYLKHEITPSVMKFTAAPSVPFVVGEQLVGQTSNASGQVVIPGAVETDANALYFYTRLSPVASMNTVASSKWSGDGKPFAEGEVVLGKQSGATATIGVSNSSYTAITPGDYDLKWLPIPSSIIAITKIIAPFDVSMTQDILFNPMTQFGMLGNFTNNESLIPYVMGRQYQQLLNDTFRGRPGIRFQRHESKLYIDVNWYLTFQPRQFVVVECFKALDPSAAPDVWSDRWLQDYATALIKKQWAQNMSKFIGIQLPGGVTLDAKAMKDEANDEIKTLEEELRTTYQLPIDFMVG
jgi:hypothetical protein